MAERALPQSRSETAGVLVSVPAMPAFRMGRPNGPPTLIAEHRLRHTVGALPRSGKKGGDCLVVARVTAAGLRFLERFPLTEDGWAAAWHALERLDSAAAESVRRELEQIVTMQQAQAALAQLDARTVSHLRGVVFLGGYAPGVGLLAGDAYDMRFLEDSLGVYPIGKATALAELPYDDVEAVDIGGPGLVKTGGGVVGGGFGLAGAVEGIAIAAVLNALTTQVKIKTVLRIQGSEFELFMLNSTVELEALRIELSRPLGAIRAAQATKAGWGNRHEPPVGRSLADEIGKLAALLDRGLLTRDEFDAAKAKLIAES